MPDRLDPYSGYNFSLELDGLTRAGFRSCSGLESTAVSTTHREGTDRALSPRRLPGLHSDGDITLSRGVTADDTLRKWYLSVRDGGTERHDVSISLLDDAGAVRITWNLFECRPAGWTGPDVATTSDETEVSVEQLVLTCERIEVDSWR